MSDIMTPISFENLMNWILKEHEKGTIFGIRKPFKADPKKTSVIFGRKLETCLLYTSGLACCHTAVKGYGAGVSNCTAAW